MNKIFDSATGVLEKSLDLYLTRHSVIADNIANAETPNFKARQVEFEDSLQKAIGDNSILGEENVQQAVASVAPQVHHITETGLGQDLNTVDMDKEMAALSKNDTKYSAAAQLINRKFSLLRYAISDGGDK